MKPSRSIGWVATFWRETPSFGLYFVIYEAVLRQLTDPNSAVYSICGHSDHLNSGYFVQDCPSDTIWRKEFFPEYKEQRKTFYKSSKWQGGPVFKHVYQTLLPKLIKELSCHHYRIPTLEADDVIYLLREKFAAESAEPETSAKSTTRNPQWRYVIITNDHDYLQLLDADTELINLQKKLLRTKSCGDPLIDLEKKIIGGDSSDNIPACFPRCGKKTLDKLARDPKQLEQWFVKHSGSREKYLRNRRLIDFREIPEKYRSLL